MLYDGMVDTEVLEAAEMQEVGMAISAWGSL